MLHLFKLEFPLYAQLQNYALSHTPLISFDLTALSHWCWAPVDALMELKA